MNTGKAAASAADGLAHAAWAPSATAAFICKLALAAACAASHADTSRSTLNCDRNYYLSHLVTFL